MKGMVVFYRQRVGGGFIQSEAPVVYQGQNHGFHFTSRDFLGASSEPPYSDIPVGTVVEFDVASDGRIGSPGRAINVREIAPPPLPPPPPPPLPLTRFESVLRKLRLIPIR